MGKPQKKTPVVANRNASAPAGLWLFPLLVCALTLIAFWPALHGKFVNWDDDRNFLANPDYRGLGWSQLHWMFTTFFLGPYQPLSWLTLGIDYTLWGMDPFGYHLTNVVLHTANALLVYLLALKLLSVPQNSEGVPAYAQRIAASVAALLFAIHPLRVESVAWVTERRDVLSGFFALLTVLAYVEAVARAPQSKRYVRWLAASVALFALSLLSKASAMTLPAALLLMDVFLLRRRQGIWIEKIPFAALSIAAAAAAVFGQTKVGVLTPVDRQGPLVRIAQGAYGMMFYVWKEIAPFRLASLYETPFRANPLDVHFLAAAGAILAITIGAFLIRNRWPSVFLAWAGYVIVLAPVSGIAHGGGEIVADRYSYIPCIALALLGGGAVLACWRAVAVGKLSSNSGRAIAAGICAILIASLWLTSIQVSVWRDSEALWRHALRLHPLANLGPGDAGLKDPNVQAYIAQLKELGGNSAYWAICYNLAVAVRDAGHPDEAAELYERAVMVNPSNPELENNWGVSLMDLKRFDDAATHLEKAAQLKPDYSTAFFNLGRVRGLQHHTDEEIAAYQKSAALDPLNAGASYNLGVALADAGRLDEAITAYHKAVEGRPDYGEAYNNLGVALVRRGDMKEAVEAFQRAVAIDPANAGAKTNLSQALALDRARQ